MFRLADGPAQARAELESLVLYLATYASIDGELDQEELALIRSVLGRAIEERIDRSHHATPEAREERLRRTREFFEVVFHRARTEVEDLLQETVTRSESQEGYVKSRLEQRCYEVFAGFPTGRQWELMALGDEVLLADGRAHPAELQLRDRLSAVLQEPVEAHIPAHLTPRLVEVESLDALPHEPRLHPLLHWLEHDRPGDARQRHRWCAAEQALVAAARRTLARQARRGRGRLARASRVEDWEGRAPFLDGGVRAMPLTGPGERELHHDLLVLGDLHGCYGCLVAALHQWDLFGRLAAWQRDPLTHPRPLLVLLGDYIDRGRFGLTGVLRTVLQLYQLFPENVVPLVGNHEWFLEAGDTVVSGVQPAESIERARTWMPSALLHQYKGLFEELPHAFFLGPVVFTHGGLPRDDLARLTADPAGLEDPRVRMQMLWSGPGRVDLVPRSLQQGSVRFSFGRLQALAFLQQLGCHTLVRGHDRIREGFRQDFDDEEVGVWTVFSCGGRDNDDLPARSPYRTVTPRALSGEVRGRRFRFQSWPIDYAPYNRPELNGFHLEDADSPRPR